MKRGVGRRGSIFFFLQFGYLFKACVDSFGQKPSFQEKFK